MSTDPAEQARRDFVARYLPAARTCEEKVGVPAMISMGQAALESAWGAKVSGYALFGIKADASWRAKGGRVVLQDTCEWVGGKKILYRAADRPDICSFRAYATPEEAFIDHALFLEQNRRYAPCFKLGKYDVQGWAAALQAAGYSTSPTYASTLLDVVASVKRRMA